MKKRVFFITFALILAIFSFFGVKNFSAKAASITVPTTYESTLDLSVKFSDESSRLTNLNLNSTTMEITYSSEAKNFWTAKFNVQFINEQVDNLTAENLTEIINNTKVFMLQPNSTAYKPLPINYDETTKIFTFSITPDFFTKQNNPTGLYKIYATTKLNNYTFNSNVTTFNFYGDESTFLNEQKNYCSIQKKIVKNTKSTMQAFEFTLKQPMQVLDQSKIIWVINDKEVVGTGTSIVYEPTNNKTFTISAKYSITSFNPETYETNNYLQDVQSLIIQPQSTSLPILIGVVGVIALALILTSVVLSKVLNKKRDVVW